MGQDGMTPPRPIVAAVASTGAGVIHAAAVGLHAEHHSLVLVFATLAIAQTAAGTVSIGRPTRAAAAGSLLVNLVAVCGWILTRTSGVSFIAGLEVAERPQVADSLCALLGAVAVVGFWAALAPDRPSRAQRGFSVAFVVALAAAGLTTVRGHDHSHGQQDETAASAFVIGPRGELVLKDLPVHAPDRVGEQSQGETDPGPAEPTSVAVPSSAAVRRKAPAATSTVAPTTTAHDHTTTPAAVLAAASGWPRVWDPASTVDVFANVGGVTTEQEARARALVAATQRDLPQWSDYASAVAAGWKSIADQSTGYEHLVNQSLVNDGKFLDSTAPESLVYRVSNGTKTLVSAMYISPTGTSLEDPLLTGYAGPLMQWHIHNNLCFGIGASGSPVVVGLTDASGFCRTGVKQTNGSPMVHVWIAAHPCGPFAAVEGVAAGLASVPDSQRLDLCSH